MAASVPASSARWLPIPQSKACSAPIISPSSTMRAALARPISASRRCPPPAPGIRPKFVSGSPICAPAPRTTRSAIKASSNPPPSAYPSTAATKGLGKARIAAQCRLRRSTAPWALVLSAISVISAPAAKLPSAPHIITALQAGSAPNPSNNSASRPSMAVFNALRAPGRFNTSRTQAPFGSTITSSIPALLRFARIISSLKFQA